MRRILFLGTLLLARLLGCSGAEAATTVGTFAELRDAVKNPASLDIALGADITLTEAIPVSLDAKIAGNGKTLTANGNFRHFKVSEVNGAGPTFDGVTFTGAGGGGVDVGPDSKAAFKRPVFRSNRAVSGGAVSVASGATAKIEGGTFEENESTADGGALHVSGTGKAEFSGTVVFARNRAAGSGGAVFLSGAAAEFPTGVRFEENTAANGGAVALSASAASTATFNGNVLSPNRATANGGALHIAGAATVVFAADQEFRGNSARDGGAIWAEAFDNAPAHKLTFQSNSATGSGGALFVNGRARLSGELTFADNKAAFGGAVHAAADLEVSGGTFSKNQAADSGGAIRSGGTVTVGGGTFEPGNEAKGSGPNSGGGAIWAKIIRVEAAGNDPVRFSGQIAQKDGGALYSDGALTVRNALFSENKASGSGGAALAKGGVSLESSAFRKNSSGQRGGAVYAGDTTEIARSVFEGNGALGDGGALVLDKSTANFKMTATAMEGNSAGDFAHSGRGGALFLKLDKAEIVRSTFAGNKSRSTTNAQGGAASLSVSKLSDLTNCTFTGNEVTGDVKSHGGALFLGGPFVLRHCTLSLENKAAGAGERQGGGLFVDSGRTVLAASLVVGNKADHGADVYRGGGTVSTGGYNRIGRFGNQGTGAGDTSWANPSVEGDTGTDRQNDAWVSFTFFGNKTLSANDGPKTDIGLLSAPDKLKTLELSEMDSLDAGDRAMDAIPSDLPGFPGEDQRGISRPQPANGKKDAGAFEVEQSGGGGNPNEPSLSIRSLRMSGIPNTLTRVGQTATLIATVVYTNGTTSTAEQVSWSSSNPGVARIDAFGNIVALSLGRTVVSVSAQRRAADGKPATDSATLEVREEMSYTNVHPEIWAQLGLFNDTMGRQGAGLGLLDSNPARVRTSAFQNAFQGAWKLSPAQVTRLSSPSAIRFESGKAGSMAGWNAAKPAMAVSLTGRKKGDMLPLKYRWSLTWDELRKLTGGKANRSAGISELFGPLKLAFTSANGEPYDVVGGDGVPAAQAESKGALKLTGGNNGVTLELTAFVADAPGPTASTRQSGPQLIDGLLVVPDGAADGTIAGSMGLLQKAGGGGSGKDGSDGKGGGCDAGVSGMMLTLVVAFLLRRKA